MGGEELEKAAEEVAYLLSRGYEPLAVAEFVAVQRRLSDADRAMLATSSRLRAHYSHHIARELDPEDVARRSLRIDAANLFGTVGAALAGHALLRSPAGVICDPGWKRGADLTILDDAIDAVVAALKPLRLSSARFYIASVEAPLAERVTERAGNQKFEIKQVEDVAAALNGCSRLCSSDPELLDQCVNWFNLVARVLEKVDARIVSLDF